nr:hypothetical protein HmN_000207000 [Hymenolepis microstoma]
MHCAISLYSTLKLCSSSVCRTAKYSARVLDYGVNSLPTDGGAPRPSLHPHHLHNLQQTIHQQLRPHHPPLQPQPLTSSSPLTHSQPSNQHHLPLHRPYPTSLSFHQPNAQTHLQPPPLLPTSNSFHFQQAQAILQALPTLQPPEEESVQLSDSTVLNGSSDRTLPVDTPLATLCLNASEDVVTKSVDTGNFNVSTPHVVGIPLNVQTLDFSQLSSSTRLIFSSPDASRPSAMSLSISVILRIHRPIQLQLLHHHLLLLLVSLIARGEQGRSKEVPTPIEMSRMQMTQRRQAKLSTVREHLVCLEERIHHTIRAIDQLMNNCPEDFDSDPDATKIASTPPSEHDERSQLDSESEQTLVAMNMAKVEALVHCVKMLKKALTQLADKKYT